MYKRENAIYIKYSLCYEVAINRRLSHRRKNIEEVSISMKTADDRQKVGKKLKKKKLLPQLEKIAEMMQTQQP